MVPTKQMETALITVIIIAILFLAWAITMTVLWSGQNDDEIEIIAPKQKTIYNDSTTKKQNTNNNNNNNDDNKLPFKLHYFEPYQRNLLVWSHHDAITAHTTNGVEWEPHIAEAIVNNLKPNTTFIDIGANIGLTTASVYHRVKHQNLNLDYIMIEMQNVPGYMAEYNTNNVPNRTIYYAGLSDTSAQIVSWNPGSHDNNGGTSIRDDATSSNNSFRVPTIQISDLHIDKPISVVKIDIEGAEDRLIRQTSQNDNFWSHQRPETVIIEIWPDRFDEIDRLFDNQGYNLAEHLGGHDYIYRPV